MINYTEEQENELQALESIYPSELTVKSRTPKIKFSVVVKSEDDCYEEPTEEDEHSVTLTFEYTPKYPDEAPVIYVDYGEETLEADEQAGLIERLNEAAKENLGMVMVFTLIQSALEWLNERKDSEAQRRKDDVEAKKRAIEQEEQKRFEGTRVTVESFLKWKDEFDREMAVIKAKDSNVKEDKKKLTGRELFEKDSRLNESDLQFLEDGDVAADISYDESGVKVDVSLFENLDDLDIDDEDFGEDDDD